MKANMDRSDRYEAGLRKLEEIDGPQGLAVADVLAKISPDFTRYLVEFAFGDVMSRPGLDLRSRELATVAGLTVLGHGRPQLKVHVGAALHVGCRREEILEVIIQMSVYAGFPAAINALTAAQEAFDETA